MTSRLDAIEARVEAATPGEWKSFDDTDTGIDGDVRVCFTRDGEKCEWCISLSGETIDGQGAAWTPATLARWKADAAFIAAARTDIPYLLAVARAAERLAELWSHPDECFKRGCTCGLAALESALAKED